MKDYEFTLKFLLLDKNVDYDECIKKLESEGCTDALIGIGKKGYIALNFNRQSKSAYEAISSAITDVKKAIPNTKLIEASPDFVGLTDISELFGFTRQNMRKIRENNTNDFPPPVHEGLASIWHLSKVLSWLKEKKLYKVDDIMLETSKMTMLVNITKEVNEIENPLVENIKGLLI